MNSSLDGIIVTFELRVVDNRKFDTSTLIPKFWYATINKKLDKHVMQVENN